jgi:crotonobetainyl-CoA:carnitine CoA-transferase CaiB-like acyl-CoA transferase
MSFGPEGPRALAPGFDMVIQALVGLERRAGGPSSDPLWYRTPYLDYGSGALGAIAVLMALYELRTEHRASDMWVSLLNAGLFLMADVLGTADGSWLGPASLDSAQLGTHPTERLYRTADGWIAVAARNDDQATALWRVLVGDGSAGPGEAWDDAVAHRLGQACGARNTQDVLDALRTAGVWAAPCTTDGLADMLGSAAARNSGWACSRPDERFGQLYGSVGPLVSLQRGSVPAAELRGAPARGAHTHQILQSLGYSGTEIDELYATGVVE